MEVNVARARRPLATDVHHALVAQNAGLAASPARDANLTALAAGAAAVVTGQQVGLFLGPLYTLYKAASAVALARALAASSGVPVVPVFWLQTEDHDLVEIASCGMPGETIAIPVDAANRRSIAHLALPAEVAACLDRVETLLGDGPNGHAHVARLRRHYQAGVTWGRAFAGVLAELFAPEGLVLVDPRDPALAARAQPIHARALDDASAIAAALIERGGELERAGQAAPVHVRPGAPLSFFHPDGAAGPRVRLAPTADPDAFVEVGGTRVHTRNDLHAALRADPLRFSTSALLRPILQDTLLPTAAYVGGPAEVAYLAQLAPLYRAFDLQPPAVVRRASFRIVDARVRTALDRLGLAPDDLATSEDALLGRLRQPALTATEVRQRVLEPALAGLATLPAGRAVDRTRATVERAIGKLASKLERDALHADGELVATLRRLRDVVAPGGAPQERVLGLCAFAARSGDRAIVERVLAAIALTDPTTRELP